MSKFIFNILKFLYKTNWNKTLNSISIIKLRQKKNQVIKIFLKKQNIVDNYCKTL
jgi:hypothetical protein